MGTYNVKVVQARAGLWHAYPAGQPNLVATGTTRSAALEALTFYLRAQESDSVSCTTEESTTIDT